MKSIYVSKHAEAAAGHGESNVLKRLLAAAGLMTPKVKPADKAELSARIEVLAATRLRKLKLPPDIMALYRVSQDASARRMAVLWAVIITIFILLNLSFNFWMIPAPALDIVIYLHLTAALLFLLSAELLRERRLQGFESLFIILPCALIVAMAGVVGDLSSSADIFRANVTMTMVVGFTAIIFTPLDLRASLWLTLLSTLALSGVTMGSPLQSPAEKIQLVFLLTATMGAIVYGKQIQDIYRIRLFVLQTRDELRTAEAARRNEQLSSIAYTDRLTDIPNRRFFDEIVDTINADPQHVLPLAICLLDIDHFKILNDQLGHLQGDRCLRVVATTIRNHLRHKSDIVARFGGEEFVLLLPNTDHAAALEVTERVRQAVLALNHPNPGTSLARVSVSAGLAIAETPEQLETLLQAADQALYRAKEAGRNRVEV